MKWYRSFSLRRRIAALVAGGVLATVVVVGMASWLFARHYLLNQTDQNLRSVANRAAADPNLFGYDALGQPTVSASGASALSFPFQIDSVTAIAQRPATLPFSARDGKIAAKGGYWLRSTSIDGRTYRMITVQVPGSSHVTADTFSLQVAENIEPQQESLHKLALLLIFLGIAGAAFASILGAWIARASLRPIRQLTQAAEEVTRTDDLASPIELDERDNSDDEVARLARSFNTMLAALAQSRERQRALVADAGHELRTPLTSLRTNIELLAREDPARGRVLDPADRARLLSDVTAQTTELASLIGDLTDLAREDSSQHAREHVDLADVVQRAVERVRRRGQGVQVVTEIASSPVFGRPVQLERAVLNLLDNAVKWSPAGGEVYVGLRDGELVVADQGPGIAAEDRPHVFERFYRATTSREKPGSGLGLAIVAQAAKEHGGTVVADATPEGGTLMRFTIPLEEEPVDEAPAGGEPPEAVVPPKPEVAPDVVRAEHQTV